MHHAEVQIITDSISPEDIRLTTFQLRYWRSIHSELMTHRVFSRNAGSSRARPSKAIIEQVRNDPWGPLHWGANQAGMQSHELLKCSERVQAERTWSEAAQYAAQSAQLLVEANVHKQIVNRLLEPFTYIDVVLTATDFKNWFALRDHPDAQPEIQDLARRMKQAMDESTPKLLQPGEWHLPYILEEDWDAAQHKLQEVRVSPNTPSFKELTLEIVRKVSTARCARVSYKAFDGNVAPIEKDTELCHQLLVSEPLHASPAEHQATPDVLEEVYITDQRENCWRQPHLHGNFRGWVQYRKTLPNEFISG